MTYMCGLLEAIDLFMFFDDMGLLDEQPWCMADIEALFRLEEGEGAVH